MRLPGPTHLAIALGGAAAPAVQFVLWGGGAGEAAALGGLTGAATGAAYSLHRVIKSRRAPEDLPPERRAFLLAHGGELLAAWGMALLAAGCAFLAHAPQLAGRMLSPAGLVGGALAGAATLGYAVLPGRRAAGRELPGAKLPWIALTWAGLSVAFPAWLVAEGSWPAGWGWAAAAQAAFVAGITVPFDVRDAEVDAQAMRTLPQRVGASHAVRWALCWIALSAVGFLLADPAAGRWLVSVAALLAVSVGSVPRRQGYYDFVLDGLLTAQLVALLV